MITARAKATVSSELKKLNRKEIGIRQLGAWFEKVHPCLTYKVTINELVEIAESIGMRVMMK